MSRNLKITIIILITGLISFGVFYIYTRKSEKLFEDKVAELGKLIIESRDCSRVIIEAEEFLSKQKDATEIWNLLGVCQFDTGQFDEAKASFEKVLSLDSSHEAAQNYLEQITNASPNEVFVTATELPLEKTEFESLLGLNFEGVLSFQKAVRRPSNILEFLVANYTSSGNFASVVLELKEILAKADTDFTVSEMEGGTIFAIGNGSERKIINIEKNAPVSVTIYYQKLN